MSNRARKLDPWKNRNAMALHLKKIEGQGERAVGTPTPERALKSDRCMRQGDDKVVRLEDAPLEKLANKCQLAPGDKRLNAILKATGDRYYGDHYLAGLMPFAAIDPSRIQIDGGGALIEAGLPSTLNAEFHRRRWREAAQSVVDIRCGTYHLGPKLLAVLDAVVLKEEPLLSVGRRVSAYREAHAATALAMERLLLALNHLAAHYGFLTH